MGETGMLKVDRVLGRLQEVVGLIGAAFIAMVVLMTGLDVVMRWFGRPLTGVIEFSQLFMVPLIWLGIAFTMRVGGHVRMEMLSDTLFRGRRDVCYWICVRLILLVFIVLMCLSAYDGMIYSMNSEEFGDITGIPVYPFKMMLFGGCVLFALELLCGLALNVHSLLRGPEVTPP